MMLENIELITKVKWVNLCKNKKNKNFLKVCMNVVPK